jgi:hypothetical protein
MWLPDSLSLCLVVLYLEPLGWLLDNWASSLLNESWSAYLKSQVVRKFLMPHMPIYPALSSWAELRWPNWVRPHPGRNSKSLIVYRFLLCSYPPSPNRCTHSSPQTHVMSPCSAIRLLDYTLRSRPSPFLVLFVDWSPRVLSWPAPHTSTSDQGGAQGSDRRWRGGLLAG